MKKEDKKIKDIYAKRNEYGRNSGRGFIVKSIVITEQIKLFYDTVFLRYALLGEFYSVCSKILSYVLDTYSDILSFS